MPDYDRDCMLCRVMRSMAFSGMGAGLGAILTLLLGGTRQTAMLAALVLAAVFVLGFADKKQR